MNQREYEKKAIKWWMSWWIIIICWFSGVFTLVSLFILWQRSKVDCKLALIMGRVLRFFAILTFLLAVLVLMIGVSIHVEIPFVDSPIGIKSRIIFGIEGIVIIWGVFLEVIGTRLMLKSREIKRYLQLIVNENLTNLDEIAEKLSKKRKKVEQDLDDMIDVGFFPSGAINRIQGIFILDDRMPREADPCSDENKHIVTCQSCGANNIVPIGKLCRCEYCGNYLQG